jgi:hypothetical protein
MIKNKSNTEIDLCLDLMILESFLDNNKIIKNADSSIKSDLVHKITNHFSENLNPNDKAGSLLNLLAPTAVTLALKALGFGKIGWLIGIAMSVFNIDISKILSSVFTSIKPSIESGTKLSSEQIDNIVSQNVYANYKPLSAEEEQQAERELQKSSSIKLRDAKLLKIAIDKNIFKEASIVSMFAPKLLSALKTIISTFFKIGLASAGLIVAGDVVNRFLARPQINQPTTTSDSYQSSQNIHTSVQTKFKLNPSYNVSEMFSPRDRIQKYINNKNGISQMIVDFALDVYQNLEGLENEIRSTKGFNDIVFNIELFNNRASGDPIVIIPNIYSSKKQIVDQFIDELASKTNSNPSSTTKVIYK